MFVRKKQNQPNRTMPSKTRAYACGAPYSSSLYEWVFSSILIMDPAENDCLVQTLLHILLELQQGKKISLKTLPPGLRRHLI